MIYITPAPYPQKGPDQGNLNYNTFFPTSLIICSAILLLRDEKGGSLIFGLSKVFLHEKCMAFNLFASNIMLFLSAHFSTLTKRSFNYSCTQVFVLCSCYQKLIINIAPYNLNLLFVSSIKEFKKRCCEPQIKLVPQVTLRVPQFLSFLCLAIQMNSCSTFFQK